MTEKSFASDADIHSLADNQSIAANISSDRAGKQAHTRALMHERTHARTRMHARTHTHARTHACTHTHAQARTRGCMHTRMHARMHGWLYGTCRDVPGRCSHTRVSRIARGHAADQGLAGSAPSGISCRSRTANRHACIHLYMSAQWWVARNAGTHMRRMAAQRPG